MKHIRIFILIVLCCLPIYIIASHNTTSPKNEGGKNILFYLLCGSYSMRISIWPLIEAMAQKGHHVTFISSHKSRNPNQNPAITDFTPPTVNEWYLSIEHDLDMVEIRKNGGSATFWYSWPDFGTTICEKFYGDSEVQDWIKKAKLDLIVVDSFMNECAYGLAHVFKAKTIMLSTFNMPPWFFPVYGIPEESSWIPDVMFAFPADKPTFISRLVAAVNPLIWQFIREYSYFPQMEEIAKRGLHRDNLPAFSEIEKNTSMVFLTTHFTQEYARSFPPNVIPIGGLVLTGKVKPLPKKMEDFINKGKNGFMYISFGTMFEFADLEKEMRDAFMQGVLHFPEIQFIWKSTRPVGVELPANFMVTKWAPQQDILAHPKIKAFITHAGLGGINEAIFHAVPMISFPLFGEQDHNSNFLEARGFGIRLEMITLKASQLQSAINAVTKDIRYRERIQMASKLFKNRPMSALNSAVWWTEFVLQYESEVLTKYLQPHSVNQSWWMRRQLDVWLFLSIVAALAVIIPSYTLYIIWRRLFGRSKDSQKDKVKKH